MVNYIFLSGGLAQHESFDMKPGAPEEVRGEFGRTPKISMLPGASLPGRDHWGACQTVFLAGDGVRGGTVIGSSDNLGAYPDSAPQKPENLAATIYAYLLFLRAGPQ